MGSARMNYCPTRAQLNLMSKVDRHFALERHAKMIADERDMLLRGEITPSDGKTKIELLNSCRSRLAHVRDLADHYDITLDIAPEGGEAEFV